MPMITAEIAATIFSNIVNTLIIKGKIITGLNFDCIARGHMTTAEAAEELARMCEVRAAHRVRVRALADAADAFISEFETLIISTEDGRAYFKTYNSNEWRTL